MLSGQQMQKEGTSMEWVKWAKEKRTCIQKPKGCVGSEREEGNERETIGQEGVVKRGQRKKAMAKRQNAGMSKCAYDSVIVSDIGPAHCAWS